MRKLQDDPITQGDLVEFLDSQSDFSFELRILNFLNRHGFECEHGGSYEDSTTGKSREFDIRATKGFGARFLRLAIECKNLRANYPALISRVPRTRSEAFNDLVIAFDPDTMHGGSNRNYGTALELNTSPAFRDKSTTIRLNGSITRYPEGEPVGKSCDQVGRTTNGIVGGDRDFFDRWSQAVKSAEELISRAYDCGEDEFSLCLVIPIVVVPNRRLWVADFTATGERTGDPVEVDFCDYYVDAFYWERGTFGTQPVALSHVEFVTERGLGELIEDITGTAEQLEKSFPTNALNSALGK